MRSREAVSKYATESEMCAQFSEWAARHGWTPYPETAGWDVLLVRKGDGYQIGIQAKLAMNFDVLMQTLDRAWHDESGPDYRAMLVPQYSGRIHDFQSVSAALGLTIIVAAGPGEVKKNGSIKLDGYQTTAFRPGLPIEKGDDFHVEYTMREWFERVPARRHTLPEYVPDVVAGAPAPVQLTTWKIRALKLCVLLERRGFVSRADFKHLGIDARRWCNGAYAWLAPDPPRGFVLRPESKLLAGFKKEHPRVYTEIVADFDKWAPPVPQLLVGAA